MGELDWLTARPIAHRGLHDTAKGIVENSASAVAAAMAHDYAIEVDLQLTGDGEAIVFHDADLDRLTGARGPVAERTASDLKQVSYAMGEDRIQTLAELLAQVAGKAGLVLELKSRWTGDTALARRTADVLSDYGGPVAVMSFDPAMVIALRRLAPTVTRGIVACAFRGADWPQLSWWRRLGLRHFLHLPQSAPQFVSYDIKGLRSLRPRCLRAVGLPLITWTVRDQRDAAFAAQWADQITFEGFLP